MRTFRWAALLVLVASGVAHASPDVVARADRDAREPIAARRGLDEARVERASKAGFVVHAQRCQGTACENYTAPLAAPDAARITVAELNYGPGWLAIQVEDERTVAVHYFAYAPKSGLRELVRVVTRGPEYFRATVTWDAKTSTLDVANEDVLPRERAGCPKPKTRHDVYRWKAPQLAVVSRDPVVPPCQ